MTPEIVVTKAADGLEIHNQLFLPKDLKAGERRPALIFVHGGLNAPAASLAAADGEMDQVMVHVVIEA